MRDELHAADQEAQRNAHQRRQAEAHAHALQEPARSSLCPGRSGLLR
jgi:hypothetical protein